MKKNLLTVLILALLIVNVALTAIMMISVTSTNNKTAALVDTIATVMNLQLSDGQQSAESTAPSVSLADTTMHSLGTSLTCAMKMVVDEDGKAKQTYMVFDCSLYLNNTSEDYKTYGEAIVAGTYDAPIKDAIGSVIGSMTEEQCRNDRELLKANLLSAIQNLFGSDIVYNIAISEVKFG